MSGYFKRLLLLLAWLSVGCAEAQPQPESPSPPHPAEAVAAAGAEGWRKSQPAPAAAAAFDYPVASVAQLANGLTVYSLPRPTPLVAAVLVLKSGSRLDPSNKSGLAALTARMLSEGTRAKNELELAEATEDLGSELSAAVSHDYTLLEFSFMGQDLGRALPLLAEVVQRPRFDRNAFERVKQEWSDVLRGDRQDPTQLAHIAGMRAVLGQKLGAPTQGSLSGVRAIGTGDLARFHGDFYRPELSALVLSGNVTAEKALSGARAAFEGWRSTRELPASDPEPATSQSAPTPTPSARASERRFARVIVVDRPGSVQSALFVAHPFPPRHAPGHETRELLNQILGGMFTSRLNQNLRERHGFTYGARSNNLATRNFGLWLLTTSVRSDATVPALEQILHELHSIHGEQPITAEEVTRARQELLGGYAKNLEQASAVSGDVAGLFVDGLAPDYLGKLDTLLAAQGPAELEREAAKHLQPEALVALIVGDKRLFAQDLERVAHEIVDAGPDLVD